MKTFGISHIRLERANFYNRPRRTRGKSRCIVCQQSKVSLQMSWRKDAVEKATTRQKGPSGSPESLETSWWEDAGMRTCPREAALPALWLSSSPGERERHTVMSGRVGEVNMLQSLFSLQLPLTHTTFANKLRGTYFSKNCVARLYYCVVMILHVYVYICICIMCLYS